MLVSNRLLYHRIFVFNMTSFKSRHVTLSIDISLMSVSRVFVEFQFILAETEKTECTMLFYFYFTKSQSYVFSVSVHK